MSEFHNGGHKDAWPEEYGFSIYGKGPTHIIKVVSGTVAANSGLLPGDQILQVNNDDVSGWSAEDIISLVLKMPNLPPSLGVVSRVREISLIPSPISREFGFSLVGTFPVKIHQIKSGSSASEGGINKDDIVTKIDGDVISSLFQARRLANNAVRNGGIKLSIIPAPSKMPLSMLRNELPTTTRVKDFVKRFESTRPGQAKAQQFIDKIKDLLRDRPCVIEGIVRAIKQYSDDRDLEGFVYTLTAILDPPEQSDVLDDIRSFIPSIHVQNFNTMISKALKDKQRQVQIFRRYMSFGLTLRGEHPVIILSVDKGSPADKAGLKKGDELLSLNGIDITRVPHERAVVLLQGSGSMPTLVIQTTSGALVSPGTLLRQMPCHASPSIDPQIYNALENMSVTTKPTMSMKTNEDENVKDQNNNQNNGKVKDNVKVTRLNSTWTHKYVSPEFRIHGENFDQHLQNLLMPSERRVVKRALEIYESDKDMYDILHLINSVLDNPQKWNVWYFIVQSMKGKERTLCRRLLAQMLQSQTTDRSESDSTANDASAEQQEVRETEEKPATSEKSVRARFRRRRCIKPDNDQEAVNPTTQDSISDSPPVTTNEDPVENEQGSETISVRRSRRRRTFAGIDLTSSYEEPREVSDISRTNEGDKKETHIPVKDEPVDYYEGGIKSLRRRRRETNLRRLQSAESMASTEINMDRDVTARARNSLPTVVEQNQSASLRERRRRQFRQSLDGTAALRKETANNKGEVLEVNRKTGDKWATEHKVHRNEDGIPENNLVSENGNNNNANNLCADDEEDSSLSQTTEEDSDMSLKSPLSMKGLRASFRISKKNKDIHEVKTAASESNTSSNDEKVKSKKGSKPGFLERMGMGKNKSSHSESSGKEESKSKKLFGKKSSSKKDSESKSKTDKSSDKTSATSPAPASTKRSTPPPEQFRFPDPCEFLNNDPPTPDHSFLIRNSKKRLTFSRPPKNSDTEAFLTELSAQFDDGFNIFDDLAQALQQQANNVTTQNFGAKWSYLPNGNISDDNDGSKFFQPTQTNDLSDLNLSDIEDKKDETPPFPLAFDSGDESGVGNKETLTPPPQVHYGYRDRELEWERERQNRKKRRRQAFASLTVDDDGPPKPPREPTSPKLPQPAPRQQDQTNHQNGDDDIYQVPVVRTRTRRRRQNVQTRTEQPETSYPPNTRFTRRRHPGLEDQQTPKVSDSYLASLQATQNQQSSSSTEEINVSSRPRRRGFRASGFTDNEDPAADDDNLSYRSEDVVDNPFPVIDDDLPDFAGEIGQLKSSPSNIERQSSQNSTSGGNIVYVDDDVVYAEPRSEHSTAVRLRKRSQDYPSNGILQGDLSFTDINSLLADYDEEDDTPPPSIQTSIDGSIPIPPPPPPVAPPPPPPPPPPPGSAAPTTATPINVKRLNWQKINPTDLKETVWGQIGDDSINDVVKYLDLEQHFATKKAREMKRMSLPVRSNVVSILSHKKAYNTSILLAHLKMTVSELRGVLLSSNNQRLDSSQYKQMLLYAPDDDEATKLLVYVGDVRVLNEADQFARKMVTIPGYRLRLQALMYKQGFADRVEDVRKNLECIQNASFQLRKSKSLAKVLEFVLAMGNYMNRGHNRISKATGFKIQFLADMDSTKTSDNKLTFLHILARAMYSKFPELCNFAGDLNNVRPAAKVVYPVVFQELKDMRAEWVEIRDRMPEALTKQVRGDRFKSAMENFLVQSNGSLKNLELLLANTTKEFNKTARYFGENGKTVGMQQFFSIFGEFIGKFEKADREIKSIMKNKVTHSEREII